MIRVLSLGAGVQSSALLLLLDREPDRVGGTADFAVFADTGDEPAEVYRWLDVLRGAVSIPIIVARKNGMIDSLSADQLALRTGARSPWYTLGPAPKTGGILPRNCTRDYKITPIQRAIRLHMGWGGRVTGNDRRIEQLIGISSDEAHRMKPSREAWITNRWPLVDLRWNRETCRRYVEATGLGTPPRSACVMCPFHNDGEWIRQRDTDPDAWARSVAFDAALREVAPRMGLTSLPFVHSSRVPLADVVLRAPDTSLDDHPNLFGNECEGMCGV